MTVVKKAIGSILVGVMVLLTAVSPAQAAVSDWKVIAQISELYVVGRTGVAQYGQYMVGGSEIRAVYWDGSSWQGYGLHEGYLVTNFRLVSGNGTLNASGSAINAEGDYRTYFVGGVLGVDEIAYMASGSGNVYNWNSGIRISGIYYSCMETFYTPSSSPSSIVGNALSGVDIYLSGTHPYSLTASGETYGSILVADQSGVMPDWISACATNGECGYIDADDYRVPTPVNPADVVAQYSNHHVRSIPVYDEPGSTTVVGYFDMHFGGGLSEAA